MNIIAQCDGGLCNRINNLVNGIYLSALLNRKLYIWWDLNQACHCPLEKLFSNEFNQNHKEAYTDEFVYYSPFHRPSTNYIKNKYGEYQRRVLWKYDDYPAMHNRVNDGVNKRSSEIIAELKSINSPTLIFSSSLILTEIIPESFIIKILSDLLPVAELSDRISAEIKSYNINPSVTGIHLRRTDYYLLPDSTVIKEINKLLAADKERKFLLCSDSHSAEEKFKNLYPRNILIIKDKSYIEKINTKKSNEHFSNLMRTEGSVQSALVDLYLLAHTSFEIFSPISTFAQTAFRLSKTVYPPKSSPACPC